MKTKPKAKGKLSRKKQLEEMENEDRVEGEVDQNKENAGDGG